jgi:Skp family chaperone for outer membrane proteins
MLMKTPLAIFALSLLTLPRLQAAPPDPKSQPAGGGKVAIVNTNAFRDPAAGIKVLLRALATAERELKPFADELQQMGDRYQKLAAEIEIARKANDKAAINSKTAQADTLRKSIEAKRREAQAAAEKRMSELTGPIYKDVYTALKAYAAQRGVGILLDGPKMGDALMLVSPEMDLTLPFITDYNSRHP